MSSHFSLKSLAFYGVAIGSVVLLFTVTTAYGEANLRAPDEIDGRYPISADALPGCLSGKKLVLAVQQSGVYLTGTLLPADASPTTTRIAEERPALTGQWNSKELTLQGSLNQLNCQETVQIQAAMENETLTGQLILEPNSQQANFSAQRQEVEPQAQSEAH